MYNPEKAAIIRCEGGVDEKKKKLTWPPDGK
jgi:hypothetical protein